MSDRLKELVESVSEAEMRAMCLEALRGWHRTAPDYSFAVFNDFAPPLLAALSKRVKGPETDRHLSERFASCLHYPWMAPILDFLWWMARAGLVIPFADESQKLPQKFHLTRAGVRVLEGDDSHPLLPGGIRRVQERCQGVSDDVVDLLIDAHACYTHGLHRPAIMLLGVAFESAIEDVADALATAGHLPPPIPSRAAQRLAAVRAALARRFPGHAGPMVEQRSAAERACGFADHLRQRRNDGSHTAPRFGFDDHEEIEEMLVSAVRYLPDLWAVLGSRPHEGQDGLTERAA